MVGRKKINDVDYFQCSICKFFYKERQLAQKCEDFCRANKSCSLDITKYAVKT